MIEEILKNIRKCNFKYAIINLFRVIPLNFLLVTLIYYTIIGEMKLSDHWLEYIAVLIFTIPTDIDFVGLLKLVVFPESSDVFKKYGGIENVKYILDKINNTKYYESGNMILAEEYMCNKKDINMLVKYDDILGVHKYVRTVNYHVDFYGIEIVDKYGKNIFYMYQKNQEDICDRDLLEIAKKCKNAEVGYTQKERDHIRYNKRSLKEDINEREKPIIRVQSNTDDYIRKSYDEDEEEYDDEED